MIAKFWKERIGGTEQFLYAEGPARRAPAVLFVHGGPAHSLAPYSHHYRRQLRETLNVLHWDQRGTFNPQDPELRAEGIQPDDMVGDLSRVIDIFRDFLGQDRIGLVGHSWGSYVTLAYAARDPGRVAFVFNLGQVVDLPENERTILATVLRRLKAAGRHEEARALIDLGDAPYTAVGAVGKLRAICTQLGGQAVGFDDDDKIQSTFLRDGEPPYRFDGTIPYCAESLQAALWRKVCRLSLRDRTEFAMPVWIGQGHEDLFTPFELAEQYANSLKTPSTRLLRFDHSAHWPHIEEAARFCRELTEAVRLFYT
jgi:pimeloyl-ACP methyl ester carboxylesterase